jgi:hypothetical protein
LIEVIVIILLAATASVEGRGDIETYGKAKEAWLKKFLPLHNGILPGNVSSPWGLLMLPVRAGIRFPKNGAYRFPGFPRTPGYLRRRGGRIQNRKTVSRAG